MTLTALLSFDEIWLADFEFGAAPGERPEPRCLVAREFRTNTTLRFWADDLAGLDRPPFPIDSVSLFVAYYVSAELGCFCALGWPMPARILDLYAEFRNLTNGRRLPCGNGLRGALTYFGLDGLDAGEKDSLRELALRGGPYTTQEQQALLDYCESDVLALTKLLVAMLPHIDLPRALLRGRYMAAAARMERAGAPIDTQKLAHLRQNWTALKGRLVSEIDADYGVYVPSREITGPVADLSKGSTAPRFSTAHFRQWLQRNDIVWPRLPTGSLDLSDETFRQMARRFPEIAPLRELRHALSQLRLNDLAVGSDGRNRCLLSAFRARTSRNQPSNSRFIFGPAVWLRHLIRPEPGRAIAYVDWEQQEFGIAAALSGDQAMLDAYSSGDPYLTFAKQARAAPPQATKQSHPHEREQFKICALGVQYGMGERSLAQAVGQPEASARELLRLHRETYPRFWRWSQAAVDHAMLRGWLQTVFGWRIHVGADANPRSLANFPMQANGAEMLRLACCLATERGISVCAPIHDALLIEGPAGEIESVVDETQRAMQDASEIVLGGLSLRTDVKIFRHPNRYSDPRGAVMWQMVERILADLPDEDLSQRGAVG